MTELPGPNHPLQRTDGAVAVPTLLGPTQVGGSFTARRCMPDVFRYAP